MTNATNVPNEGRTSEVQCQGQGVCARVSRLHELGAGMAMQTNLAAGLAKESWLVPPAHSRPAAPCGAAAPPGLWPRVWRPVASGPRGRCATHPGLTRTPLCSPGTVQHGETLRCTSRSGSTAVF